MFFASVLLSFESVLIQFLVVDFWWFLKISLLITKNHHNNPAEAHHQCKTYCSGWGWSSGCAEKAARSSAVITSVAGGWVEELCGEEMLKLGQRKFEILSYRANRKHMLTSRIFLHFSVHLFHNHLPSRRDAELFMIHQVQEQTWQLSIHPWIP